MVEVPLLAVVFFSFGAVCSTISLGVFLRGVIKELFPANKKETLPPNPSPSGFRRFVFQREVDVSGQSGTGIVVQGCQFDNGWVGLTWLTGKTSLTFYPDIETAISIHGHGGSTKIFWIDNNE